AWAIIWTYRRRDSRTDLPSHRFWFFSSPTYPNLILERALFLARRLRRGRTVGMERFDRLESPSLPLLAFALTPSDRLPVRGEDQPRAGIRDLNPVASRLVHV